MGRREQGTSISGGCFCCQAVFAFHTEKSRRWRHHCLSHRAPSAVAVSLQFSSLRFRLISVFLHFCFCRSLVDTVYALKDEVKELKQVIAVVQFVL